MIDYETFCKIQAYHEERGLKPTQIARALELDRRTVANWLAEPRFRARRSSPRASKLDAFKARIRQWLEAHDYSGQQIFQRLREEGFEGGRTIVMDYVARVRPRRAPAFLTLSFAPGECAQVDWGSYGTVAVGESRRQLSLFVMVLCYRRLLYVEFTLNQRMEQFLACHQNAFAFFGNRVPQKIMVDNLKSAVLRRLTGEAPVLNPRYLDFARHAGFRIVPCNKGKGNEKGRVESAVGYVKKNFLNALEIPDFSALNPAARVWMDTIANVRIHGETHQRPLDLFAEEQAALQSGPLTPFDVATLHQVRASPRFRISYDANRYSVPAEHAGTLLTLKVYPDRLCLYHHDKLLARHVRCYERHRDIEGSASSQGAARAAPQRPRAEALRALPRPLATGRGLLPSAGRAPPQSRPSCAEDRRLERDLRYRGGGPRHGGRLHLPGLQLRVHRQSVGKPPAPPARARGPAADPAPGSARAGDARAGLDALRH